MISIRNRGCKRYRTRPGGRGEHQGGLGCPYNQHEYSFGVMPESPVREISRDALGQVEPRMQRQVVGNLAAPFFHRGEGVMVRMGHDRLPQNLWLVVLSSV